LSPQKKGNENKNNPYLISQFIDASIEYWSNKYFFLAEGSKLYYQLDLFLERIKFQKNRKVKFIIEDEHGGGDYLDGLFDIIFNKTKDQKGVFNKSLQSYKVTQRSFFGHGKEKII
jgi:hypothetical protein